MSFSFLQSDYFPSNTGLPVTFSISIFKCQGRMFSETEKIIWKASHTGQRLFLLLSTRKYLLNPEILSLHCHCITQTLINHRNILWGSIFWRQILPTKREWFFLKVYISSTPPEIAILQLGISIKILKCQNLNYFQFLNFQKALF